MTAALTAARRGLTRAAIAAVLSGLLWFAGPAAPACAAEAVTSAATWRVSGSEVSLRLAFPRQAVRLLGQPGKPLPATEAVARQVLAQSAVSQDGAPCPAVDLGYDLGRIEPLYLGPALMGFEMQFRCPHAQGALLLSEQALSARGVPHIGLAALYIGAAPPVTRLMAGDSRIPWAAGHTTASSVAAYAWLGVRGLPGRLLELATLCGLLLLVRRRGELAGLAAGVGAGYLAAGLAACGGWVLAHGPAGAFDGALVLLTAALLMGRASGEQLQSKLRLAARALAAVAGLCAGVALLRGQMPIALTLASTGLLGFSLLSLERLPGVCAARLAVAGLCLGAVDGFALPLAVAPLHALVPLPAAGALGYNLGAAAAVLLVLLLLTQLRRVLGMRARLLDAPWLADLAAAALGFAGAFQVLTV